MTKETKNNGHPEGGIYEQFAYPKIVSISEHFGYERVIGNRH